MTMNPPRRVRAELLRNRAALVPVRKLSRTKRLNGPGKPSRAGCFDQARSRSVRLRRAKSRNLVGERTATKSSELSGPKQSRSNRDRHVPASMLVECAQSDTGQTHSPHRKTPRTHQSRSLPNRPAPSVISTALSTPQAAVAAFRECYARQF